MDLELPDPQWGARVGEVKGCGVKVAIGSEVVTGCVVDTEQIAESTGSTSQVWSTNSGTQPLT